MGFPGRDSVAPRGPVWGDNKEPMTLLDALRDSIRGAFMVFLSPDEREAILSGILPDSVVNKVRQATPQGE